MDDAAVAWRLVVRELEEITGDATQLQKVIRKAATMSEDVDAAATAFVESLRVMARHRARCRIALRYMAKA